MSHYHSPSARLQIRYEKRAHLFSLIFEENFNDDPRLHSSCVIRDAIDHTRASICILQFSYGHVSKIQYFQKQTANL